jgi:two-component system cell cycle sensor histidine kinase/response regulator CckA
MKVLFMSGYTDQSGVNSGLPTGEAGFIQKPFTPAALSSKVREILGTNGQTSHGAGG